MVEHVSLFLQRYAFFMTYGKKRGDGYCHPEKFRIFEAFFERTIFNMLHIFGNMVYLNIKERDRFYEGA